MPDSSIISILNLSCSYTLKEEDKILFIKELELQRGKIIFLLGASGTGKSTLLETLGLMNNTISTGTVKFFSHTAKKYDFAQLWKNSNEVEINSIRKNFLSFIFQNTNLMENFTAYENICLSQMIKSNADQSKVMDIAEELMKQVRLPQSEVGYDALSVNLSGGQRQRVSFVRALNTDYELLLCDEPTGNLDEVNARELLNIVKQNLHGDKTAVMVSHDVNLALKYADQVILITKNPEKGHGEILPQNIFQSDQWSSLGEKELIQFRSSIVELFLPVKKEKIAETAGKKIAAVKKATSYKDLFLKKEGRILMGKSYLNLMILITIISITFLAIGFANGALNYLHKKINDPFVNWFTIKLPGTMNKASTVDEIKDTLNTDKVRNTYLINSVTAYKELPLFLFPYNQDISEHTKGRLMSIDDPISKDLFSVENIENKSNSDTNFQYERDMGIVVTGKLLTRLGYPPDAKVIYLDNSDKDVSHNASLNYKVPIPIRAVIKEIPNRNNFIITNFFHNSYNTLRSCIFDYKEQTKRIIIYSGSNKESARELAEEIKNNFNKLTDQYTLDDMTIDLENCELFNEKGYAVSVSFNTRPDEPIVTENLYQKIMKLSSITKHKDKFFRIFDFDIAPEQPDKTFYDYLSINFKSLDKIDDFSKYINTSLNQGNIKDESNMIDVDSGAVKEKKNFNYISKMTGLIALLLTVFSILAISLFISNLLKTHLNKVKMNIGTYKAFGLSDKESKNIYLQIMMRFIIIGLAVSLVLAFGLGKIIGFMFESSLKIDDKPEYFRLFDTQTFVLLGIIIIVTIFVSYFNINKILSKTPGDLIYNR